LALIEALLIALQKECLAGVQNTWDAPNVPRTIPRST
jgi:hypothetical protein